MPSTLLPAFASLGISVWTIWAEHPVRATATKQSAASLYITGPPLEPQHTGGVCHPIRDTLSSCHSTPRSSDTLDSHVRHSDRATAGSSAGRAELRPPEL